MAGRVIECETEFQLADEPPRHITEGFMLFFFKAVSRYSVIMTILLKVWIFKVTFSPTLPKIEISLHLCLWQ